MSSIMLIRTRQVKCKARVAVVVRVVLFFGIPGLHLLFRSIFPELHQHDHAILEKGKKIDII